MVGASLGVAFLDPRRMLFLALAGAVGFGIGFIFLEFVSMILGGTFLSIVGTGFIGGASLGAALGYLEVHEPAGRRVA